MPRSSVALRRVAAWSSLFILTGCGEAQWEVKNPRPAGDVVVAFGDSLTYGEGAAPEASFPQHLARMTGRDIVNEGHNGDTTAGALRRVDRVLMLQPSVVIVVLGGNDILRRVPAEETRKNLRAVFQKLQQSGALVVYGAIDPPFIGKNWTARIRDVCREEGVLYVDAVMKGLWNDRTKMADRVHPNGDGYRVVAERIHAVLKDHL
jgi:lysophospholipase L1-like esterase